MFVDIDHGINAIKLLTFFIAGFSEHIAKTPMIDEIMDYAGKFWTFTGNYLTYICDKTQDERYFVLTLFAIIKEWEYRLMFCFLTN